MTSRFFLRAFGVSGVSGIVVLPVLLLGEEDISGHRSYQGGRPGDSSYAAYCNLACFAAGEDFIPNWKGREGEGEERKCAEFLQLRANSTTKTMAEYVRSPGPVGRGATQVRQVMAAARGADLDLLGVASLNTLATNTCPLYPVLRAAAHSPHPS